MFENLFTLETLVRMVLFYSVMIGMTVLAYPTAKTFNVHVTRTETKSKVITIVTAVITVVILTTCFFGAFWIVQNDQIVTAILNLLQ